MAVFPIARLRMEFNFVWTLLNHGGLLANKVVYRSNPADSFGREDGGSEMEFVQRTSASGRFAQQRSARAMAQGAAPEERRGQLIEAIFGRRQDLPDGRSCGGGSAIFYEQIDWGHAAKWRGPAVILDVDDTSDTVKFQSQAS